MLADTDQEWGERVAQELNNEGNRVLFVRTDVRDSAQVDAMVARGVEAFGRVDILVHGAGVSVHKEIVELTDAEWDIQINVQLRGAFLLSRAAARQMIKQGEGGRLILIGSTAGTMRVRSGPHAASKAAEIQPPRHGLGTREDGITATYVSPGLTNIGDISRTVQHPEYQEVFVTQVPLVGSPFRTRSLMRYCSSPPIKRVSSAGRCSASMAATPRQTCDPRATHRAGLRGSRSREPADIRTRRSPGLLVGAANGWKGRSQCKRSYVGARSLTGQGGNPSPTPRS